MLATILNICIARMHTSLFIRNFGTSSCGLSKFKRFDRQHEAVRQFEAPTNLVEREAVVLPYSKTYESSSFPTLETHSQRVNGILYTELPIVHVKSTSNNTIISVTDGSGKVIAIQSGGTVGFRNAKKGTNVAAQAAAIAVAGDALRKDVSTVRVCLKGIGPGRLPALKALHLSGLNVASITDTTPLPHNGNRPKKVRRL